MNLKQFSNLGGCHVILCGPGWGGKYGYITADHPSYRVNGFKTKTEARQAWLADTFGGVAGEAVLKLLEQSKK